MAVARSVRVRGRVQGVFYRAWTREQARQLGVSGWVRNCADGSVEAWVEGEEAPVRDLIERMCHGPASAQVDDVSAMEVQPQGTTGFAVRH